MDDSKKATRIALVYGSVPSVEEIDQFQLLQAQCQLTLITSESICGYLTQSATFRSIKCIALPDYDENPSYLPGLENVLVGFDIVIVKDRLGLYGYQAVKAKLKNHFRLVVWVDNLTPFPAEDVGQMRTIRHEITTAADCFIVQSTAARKALLTEGISDAKIHSFPIFVAPIVKRNRSNRNKATETLGIGSEDFVLGYFGQVEWEEGLFHLFHAVSDAVKQDVALARRLKVIVCGIGSLSNELRHLSTQLGIDDRIIYLAPSRSAFDTLNAAVDCLYYAPIPGRDRFEGDPYRLISAMTYGIPLLANRSDLVEEFIGKHRLDFCPGSISSLSQMLKKASTAPALMKDIAKKMTSEAAKRFKADKVATQMTNILTKIATEEVKIDVNSIEHEMVEIESKVKAKQYVEAIGLIEALFKIGTLSGHHRSNLYRFVGDCFTKLGDADSGKEAYIKAIECDRYNSKAYIGMGTVALTKQSFDMAIVQMQKAVSLAPDDEMANLGLGLAFQGMGELNESSKWITRSLGINPLNTAAIYSLVSVCHAMGSFTEAENALRVYVQKQPQDHHMLYTLGGILYASGRVGESKEIMERILAVDPADERATSLLMQIARQGQKSSVGNN